MLEQYRSFIRNKFFLGALLIVGFVYVTVFCFLENPLLEENTASLIGLKYPALFFLWLTLTGAAFFFNSRAMYLSYGCRSIVGRAAIWAALCALPVIFFVHGEILESGEIFYPGVSKPVHWAATIIFMLGDALSIGILFIYACKKVKRFRWLCVGIGGIVAGMLAVFFIFGKSGLFETAPIWLAYVMLFLVNCTGLFALPKETA
ncbi:MAG: hypothetical protein FWH26_07960 [Oscillospiraceae bacterium]|nr:hypothetical protein [Oscillospiraceae bacterium]